ncbi:hypothetical protein GR255_25670, partial [Mycobacterium tuberculosis]|nr:hypothetical protein [Mycobacterium tuberculosis]
MRTYATRNGQALGLDIDGRVADAEGIPYEVTPASLMPQGMNCWKGAVSLQQLIAKPCMVVLR